MGFRKDFYTLLLDEVKQFSFDLPETSDLPFLAKQLAKQKSFSSSSAVSLLRELEKRHEDKKISELEYFRGALNIALEKKIRIQERVFKQILICDALFSASKKNQNEDVEDPFDSSRQYRFFYRKSSEILESLRNTKRSAHTDADPIKVLIQMFMSEALVQEAKDYLYDAGFSINNKTSKPRKADKSMQLLDSFFERKDSAYFLQGYDADNSPGNDLSPEKIEDTKTLFSLMDHDKACDTAVVPVVIDSQSGAGLYIYGMESDDDPVYLNNDVLMRRARTGHHCFYTIFEYWGSQRDTDDSDYAPGRLIYRQYIKNEGSRYESTGYIDLEDALHDYRKVIRQRFNDMYVYNEHMPKGTPERFIKYFQQNEQRKDQFAFDAKRIEAYKEEEERSAKDIVKDELPVYF